MPRLKESSVPAYRHHKARGLACCDIGGKRFYLGPWKSKASLVEYDRLIAEWLANGRTPPRQEREMADGITIVELIAA
jgi:hypothetical protein